MIPRRSKVVGKYKAISSLVKTAVCLVLTILYLTTLTVIAAEGISSFQNKLYPQNGFASLSKEIYVSRKELQVKSQEILQISTQIASVRQSIDDILTNDLNSKTQQIRKEVRRNISQIVSELNQPIELNTQESTNIYKEVEQEKRRLILRLISRQRTVATNNIEDEIGQLLLALDWLQDSATESLSPWVESNAFDKDEIQPLINKKLQMEASLSMSELKRDSISKKIQAKSSKRELLMRNSFILVIALNILFTVKLLRTFFFMSGILTSPINTFFRSR